MDHQVQIEIYKFESFPPTLMDKTCLNKHTDKNLINYNNGYFLFDHLTNFGSWFASNYFIT